MKDIVSTILMGLAVICIFVASRIQNEDTKRRAQEQCNKRLEDAFFFGAEYGTAMALKMVRGQITNSLEAELHQGMQVLTNIPPLKL
jgi:nucleoside recognition membrane protein YjiH